MVVSEVIKSIENFAPAAIAESFDNTGLLVGSGSMRVTGVLLTLDVIEDSIDEAVGRGLNMIVAHHPLIFSPLKSITGRDYIQRIVMSAIKHNIAIYCAHTNIDKIEGGVSYRLGEVLGLKNMKVLCPEENSLLKFVVYTPFDYANSVRKSLSDNGAGAIGAYSSCSFSCGGEGRFSANDGAKPFVGAIGELHTEREERIETIVPSHKIDAVISALRRVHPYQEMAYDIIALKNMNYSVGLGVTGELDSEMSVVEFLELVKKRVNLPTVKYSKPHKTMIRNVALCGGSGASFIGDAIRSKADIYLTGDLKYHDYFLTEKSIILADIGHFESEQFTLDIFYDVLMKKFTNFVVCKTALNCNPINYL